MPPVICEPYMEKSVVVPIVKSGGNAEIGPIGTDRERKFAR